MHAPDNDRLDAIAELYRCEHGRLGAVVRKHASVNSATVEDACAHAWMKLLAAVDVDLRPPRRSAAAWVTTTAIRRARELEHSANRATPTDHEALDDALTAAAGGHAPSVHDIAVQHARLQLVTQLPERPRRFLLRLALGYSYREIAEAEGASYTTTNKQIARAKRLLRALENPDGGESHHGQP